MIKCFGYPLTVGLGLAILLYVFKKNNSKEKFLLICFIIALLWREAVNFKLDFSYRYYNVMIIIGYLVVISQLASRKKIVAITAISAISFVQIYILYAGNKKEYIGDITNTISFLRKKDIDSAIIIPQNEINRWNHLSDKKIFPLNESKDTLDNIKKFGSWGTTVYSVKKTKVNDRNKEEIKTKRIAYMHNKRDGICEVFKIDADSSILANKMQALGSANLIYNGNCEIIMNKNKQKQSFRKWIASPNSLYAKDTTLIPDFGIMVDSWSQRENDAFPIVYADSTAPIEGKYSLHITFQEQDKLFFFQTIPYRPGQLQLSINSLKKDSIIVLKAIGYYKDGQQSTYTVSYLNPPLLQTVDYIIDLDLSGPEKILFYIEGEDINLLLDKVSYRYFE